MSPEAENLIHRLLERMRAEHSASLEAMMTELAATRRVYASMEQVHDKVDRLGADLSALRRDIVGLRGEMVDMRGETAELRSEMAEFRADTGRSLPQIQGDIVALENQNIACHGEILNILQRFDGIELTMENEGSSPPL